LTEAASNLTQARWAALASSVQPCMRVRQFRLLAAINSDLAHTDLAVAKGSSAVLTITITRGSIRHC
jgi:hypothetical protein